MKQGTVVLVGLAFLTGCYGCAHKVSVTRYTANAFEESNAAIDVYQTQRPARAYVEIAELVVDDRNGQPVAALVAKAKEIGAHGLILTGQKEGKKGFVPLGGILIGRTYMKSTGIAIRYTEPVGADVQ